MLLCSFLPFFLFSWVVLPIKIYKLSTSQSKYTGYINVEDTHRGNTPSKKTQALTKSMNIGIWEIVYQINYLKEVPKMKINFQKKKVVEKLFFVIGSFFYSPFYLWLLTGQFCMETMWTKKRCSSFSKRAFFKIFFRS